MLKLHDVTYSYPDSDRPVIEHIDLCIDKGDIIRIAGRNGAGKSTLLKVIAGELPVSSGWIERKQGLRCVYLDQFSGDMLPMDLTLLEVWSAFRKPSDKNDNGSALREMMSKFGIGLEERTMAFCGELSGGERQILALGVAVASGFDLLCLDEFTSNLDSAAEVLAQDLMLACAKDRSGAICFISHREIELNENKTIALSGVKSHE